MRRTKALAAGIVLLALTGIAWAAGENIIKHSVKYLDSVVVNWGTDLDVAVQWTGSKLTVVPLADDTEIEFGNGTLSTDLQVFGNSTSSGFSFDASADDLKLEDSTSLMFGTGAGAFQGNAGDVEIRWDGTDLDILAAADNTVVKWGATGNSFDHWFYGSDGDKYFSFDASADDLKFEDSVSVMFGTGSAAGPGAAGDVEIRWDATDLDLLAAADDTVFKIGNGTNSFDVWVYGNAATDYILWDASAGALSCTGTATIAPKAKLTAKTASYNLVGTDMNQVFTTTGAGGAVTFALPTPAAAYAGCWVRLINTVAQNMTVNVNNGVADKIITFNDLDADDVTFSTGGELIGSAFFAICDGTSWIVIPEANEAVTITVTS